MNGINQDQAIQRAKNYKHAKDGLQQAIYWIVEQTLNGNADAIYQIMRAADMLSFDGEHHVVGKDGEQFWRYVSSPLATGGLGLASMVAWDKDTNTFKMKKGKNASWVDAANAYDHAQAFENLSCRWDRFERTKKASDAFDLDKAVLRLIKTATEHGKSIDEVVAAVRTARTARVA